MSRRFPLGFVALLLSLPAMAGPARPDIIELEQPDGTRIPVRIRGDEFQGWTETLEGYTVLRNEASGLWEYAQREAVSGALRPSGHAVVPGTPAPSFLSGGLRPKRDTLRERATATQRKAVFGGRTGSALSGLSSASAVTGNKKLLVILVAFADRALVTDPSSWYGVLFQTGTGVKSVRQFYRDNSYNVVDIQPVSHTQSSTSGVVSVTIAANHPNYGEDGTYSAEIAWLNLALAQAASYVNFAALDTNGDGEITPSEAAIYFIPAGYETSGSSKTPSIWAHAWGGPSVTAGTKALTTWAMNGELNDGDRQHPMGVIAHELGHSLIDLPDLYDTNYTNYGLGHWSLMSYAGPPHDGIIR
ncbi:M6 family metalloprotease domain-containing protein [Holophaga foetida]|uniref:M6 family metalloprotease domain-containing protein n=1 Tax=Holophaga foetida TaxID=35839 RepID=UPI000247496C|nr:M6 family metalloprotease domain-containing protein [Holophaga foetida]